MSKSLGIPQNLSLQQQVELSGVLSRINSYVPSTSQSSFSPGQQITFQISNDFLDFRNHSFQFTVNASKVGGTYGRFNKDIRSIIKRMTISFGSKIVLDINNQNLLFNMLNNLKDLNWPEYQGKILNGAGDTTSRNTDFTDTARTYAVQLYSMKEELLSKVLPLQKLGLSLFINLYLADPSECIETDGSSATYTVSNCQLHIAALVASQEWDNLYMSKIPQGIKYCFRNYENQFDSSLLSAGISRASKTLNFRYSSLTGIIMVMRPSANINNLAANDKLCAYDFNNLNRFNVRIGSYVCPTDDLTNYSDKYAALCELFGISTTQTIFAGLNWSTNNFMICQNLSKHPYYQNQENCLTNGVNTSVSSAMIVDMGFSAPLAQNYSLDIFAISENAVVFQSNGGIIWEM